ncbi:ankyrin repeat and SOCS box protein 8-like [Saccostrea echinata]|uniref:ankyrin repeat and SOCS box protein 8-like n=1 Tax=Saccostrea echinata TaxID=191078 RepID=UPI002A83752E|nr:ankyrin repeat and SOCS box protein 8-like [Saccostrea echinata]
MEEEKKKTKSNKDIEDGESEKWTQESLQRLLADAITHQLPLDDIKLILDGGADINGMVTKGLRPLHYATFVNSSECVQFLINNGASVNLTDDVGYTPLHICSRKGYTDVMKILIENGATINFCSAEDGEVRESSRSLGYLTLEPLNIAIDQNHTDCVQLLLQNGARPDNKYFMGYEINLVPLDHLQCLKLIIDYGADPNTCNRCGITPLMRACRENNARAVNFLLEHGAEVDVECPPRFEQRRAIHFAIQVGNLEITEILLQNGASRDRSENYRYSPLHEAIIRDQVDLCKLLINYGSNVNERTESDATPVMLVCGTEGLHNRRQLLDILLSSGGDVNAFSDRVSYSHPCLSPLTEYLRLNDEVAEFEIVSLLVQYGARISFRGTRGVKHARDPYGILSLMHKFSSKDDMFSLLVEAAFFFDVDSIKETDSIAPDVKQYLTMFGNQPRQLKQIIRLSLQKLLSPRFPSKVRKLPVPPFLKSYLLFHI